MQSAGYAISYNGTHVAVTAFLNQACFTEKVNLFSLTVLQPRNTHRNSSSVLEVNTEESKIRFVHIMDREKGNEFPKEKCAYGSLVLSKQTGKELGATWASEPVPSPLATFWYQQGHLYPSSIYPGLVGTANPNIRCFFMANFTSPTLQNYLGLKLRVRRLVLQTLSSRTIRQHRKNRDSSIFKYQM